MVHDNLVYQTILKHRKNATIITRTRTVDPVTGTPEISETTWSGDVGFVLSGQTPRNDQVIVTDAWVITDQSLQDKSEVHVAGKAYTVLKLTVFDSYSVAALKAAAPAQVHLNFRNDQKFIDEFDIVPPDQIWVAFRDDHEFTDEMSSSVI